jgi:hypothetical protein
MKAFDVSFVLKTIAPVLLPIEGLASPTAENARIMLKMTADVFVFFSFRFN